MYAESIVQERIELAREEMKFTPEYHSTADIDTFEARLKAKYEDTYAQAEKLSQGSQNPTLTFRKHMWEHLANRLTKEEVRWMMNERVMSSCDAAYWMTRYYWISNIRNELQRFRFQSAQRCYFNVISELEARRLAIEILICKARQLGITTFFCLLLLDD